jgi:hypothetical protein
LRLSHPEEHALVVVSSGVTSCPDVGCSLPLCGLGWGDAITVDPNHEGGNQIFFKAFDTGSIKACCPLLHLFNIQYRVSGAFVRF